MNSPRANTLFPWVNSQKYTPGVNSETSALVSTVVTVMFGRAVHVVVETPAVGSSDLWHVVLAAVRGANDEPLAPTIVIGTILAPTRIERGVLALARLFRLTCAESRVLAHLTNDRRPSEIAAALGVSITTVRSHLKALFAKTGTRRQSELVALAWSAA